ncbi:MAG: hypothetical protein M3O36_20745 [Myxococcota bacterium]|nr:hypothetical protein [Myxococcota bacterium]
MNFLRSSGAVLCVCRRCAPFLALAVLVSCARAASDAASHPTATVSPGNQPAVPEPRPAEAAVTGDAFAARVEVDAFASVSAIPPEAAFQSAPRGDGESFLSQARTLFRVAACGPSGDVPTRFDAAVVARHCEQLAHAYDDYRRTWVDVAKPFIASLRPQTLPSVVVYPFGGGDLVSALATFPDASTITTISLEPAGDIRPVDTMGPDRLAQELAEHRAHLERLFEKAHSRTDNLEKEARTALPGELVFALAALVVHGAEPLALRYFQLAADGSPSYVSRAELDAAKTSAARRLLFANAELSFRRAGDDRAPVQMLRHLSFNLDDAHLKADPSLIAYLNTLAPAGRVAAMTKAATHLLWNDHFSLVRGWLLDHTDWMISDSTGIPPRIAGPAGFTQDTYGMFDGPAPFGMPDGRDGDDLKKLFKSRPARDLAFRYGYPDRSGHAHLVVTHR